MSVETDCKSNRSYRDFENLTLKTNEDSIATRIFLGLILLYEHGKFTHNQWKAISALKSNMELIRPSTSWDLSAVKTNIAFLKKAVQSKMLESDLEEYYWRVIHFLPILEPGVFCGLSLTK